MRLVLQGGGAQVFYVSGGLMEVVPQYATILADTVERAEDLDENKAQAAKRDQEAALNGGEINYTQAMAEINITAAKLRAIAELKNTAESSLRHIQLRTSQP